MVGSNSHSHPSLTGRRCPKTPADIVVQIYLLLALSATVLSPYTMAVAQPVLGGSAHQHVAHAGAVARALPSFGLFVKALHH